jgi:hypothetical protein
MENFPAVILDAGGTLAIAVRFWRQYLANRLRSTYGVLSPRPTSQERAMSTLEGHAQAAAIAAERLIKELSPPNHGRILAAEVGQLGLRATVFPEVEGSLGPDWPVQFRRGDDVDVQQSSVPPELQTSNDRGVGKGTVGDLVGESPDKVAIDRVMKAIASLTAPGWL